MGEKGIGLPRQRSTNHGCLNNTLSSQTANADFTDTTINPAGFHLYKIKGF